MSKPRVHVILVNWQGWQDTIECLESLLRLDYCNYRIIVCDNCSSDGSLEHVKDWAVGRVVSGCAPENPLGRLSFPSVAKPVPFVEYNRQVTEAGGNSADNDVPLILIQTGANLGYAGGNNVALRYALARQDCDYVWLLNNDTVVDPEALSHLVRRMAEVPEAGMCGSLSPYYSEPGRIWAQGGGSFNRWLAKSACIGNGLPVSRQLAPALVEEKLAYIAGSSLLVSRDFLERIGLMCEEYFLYYEEPDWAARGRGSFTLAYAPESVVYHKVGVSTAVINRGSFASKPTDRYIFRNALLFTRKFFPVALPLVLIRVSFNRIRGYFLNLIMARVNKA